MVSRFVLFAFIGLLSACSLVNDPIEPGPIDTSGDYNPQQHRTINPITILPLGNSITWDSYRYSLWEQLVLQVDTGINIVGTKRRNPETGGERNTWPDVMGMKFDDHNEGHSGRSSGMILYGSDRSDSLGGQLSEWLEEYDAQYVLMHVGTNDVIYEIETDSIITNLGLIIDMLRADVPVVRILMAKPLPIDENWSIFARIKQPELNDAIDLLAQEKQQAKSPIYVVDMYSGAETATHTYDGAHPNAAGDSLLTARWLEVLLPLLP